MRVLTFQKKALTKYFDTNVIKHFCTCIYTTTYEIKKISSRDIRLSKNNEYSNMVEISQCALNSMDGLFAFRHYLSNCRQLNVKLMMTELRRTRSIIDSPILNTLLNTH